MDGILKATRNRLVNENYHEMLHEAQYFYLLIAFSLSLLIHYLVIELTHRKGIFLDEHDKVQKVHEMPTPRIGGLGIFLASMFMLNDNELGGYLMLASIPAFLAGFFEDYSGRVSPEQRLAIMCLSPVMAFIMIPGSALTDLSFVTVPAVVGMLLSIVFIIALINGVNFIDGQNGLASGSVLIVLLGFAVIALAEGDPSLLYICLIMAAALAAFLWYNFPAGRIFLGDGGAYFLGFMMATLGIVAIQRHADTLSVALLPALLVYPLWEVVFSTLRKLVFDRISPFRSDDHHLHQLLFRNHAGGRGFIPALLVLPVQGAVTIAVVLFRDNTGLLLFFISLYILLYCLFYTYERRRDTRRVAPGIV